MFNRTPTVCTYLNARLTEKSYQHFLFFYFKPLCEETPTNFIYALCGKNNVKLKKIRHYFNTSNKSKVFESFKFV